MQRLFERSAGGRAAEGGGQQVALFCVGNARRIRESEKEGEARSEIKSGFESYLAYTTSYLSNTSCKNAGKGNQLVRSALLHNLNVTDVFNSRSPDLNP